MNLLQKIIKNKQRRRTKEANFSLDVLLGLTEHPKNIPSKYIYDENGSRLFEKIMELPEYYPTRCETEILKIHADDYLQLAGNQPFNFIELGAGDGRKIKILLRHFLNNNANFSYYPIDISQSAVSGLVNKCRQSFPSLPVRGLVADYFTGLRWIKINSQKKNIVFFMGSNIGNFTPFETTEFLKKLRKSLKSGDMVVTGFDLIKNFEIINNAYNDGSGITKDFNFNLLTRINNELGGNFNLNNFDYYSRFNPVTGAVESFIISLKQQDVYIHDLQLVVHFSKFEPILTEYSFKYTIDDIENLASETGFKVFNHFYDEKKYFVNSIWYI